MYEIRFWTVNNKMTYYKYDRIEDVLPVFHLAMNIVALFGKIGEGNNEIDRVSVTNYQTSRMLWIWDKDPHSCLGMVEYRSMAADAGLTVTNRKD